MHERTLTAVAANTIVCGAFALAAVLYAFAPDIYHRSVQEDEILEWTTFWAFVLAAGAYAFAAADRRRATGGIPWFLAGVALFCGVVAMEEISWGQRLIGYRPPSYFLEHNFQQEFNVHNIGDDWIRQWAYMGIVIGYGIALPLLWIGRPVARLGRRIGIVSPPVDGIPGFAATAILYATYPWTHSGEWSELMLGLAMLITALGHLERSRLTRSVILATALACMLGAGTAKAWFELAGSTPEHVEAANVELRALRSDIAKARTYKRCGLHKRVYTYIEKYDQQHLLEGQFASLTDSGLPEDRAQFFLDPWNSPYWFKHICEDDGSRRAILVYSFGPNRLRDSTEWEVKGDDIAGWISRPTPSEKD